MASSPSHRVASLFLVGPTAVGKSEAALLLGERFGGEIISADSMQVYRGMDIGTAKPTPAERARVSHHLLDIVPLTEPFDAGRFVTLAQDKVQEIQARGRLPIFCGGTGLYVKAFLDGLGDAPPGDPLVRAELEATPVEELLHELSECDPVTFERIDRQNFRRVVRAMEVIRLTGRPFSDQRADWRGGEPTPGSSHGLCVIGLKRGTEDLRARIDARVDQMFAQGLVAETKALLDCGLAENRIAMQAIGYRQAVEHLRGERSLAETVALVKIRTRQFAKRQMTWFRRQLPVTWVEVRPDEPASEIVGRVMAGLLPLPPQH